MKIPIVFYDYDGDPIIIDLSKVKAIYVTDYKSDSGEKFGIKIYYDRDSDSYEFNTKNERIAVIEKIMEILNPLCITYDDKRYVAEVKHYKEEEFKKLNDRGPG